jgi:hypothetical protein
MMMSMTEETAVQNLFDLKGRRIAPQGIGAAVNEASNRYTLVQPSIDYADIHARISEHMGSAGQVSASEFAERAEGVLDTLRRSEETAPLASSVRLPFALAADRSEDLGQALEDRYLPGLGRSWKVRFQKADFKNELKGGLAGKAAIAKGSRYDRFVQAFVLSGGHEACAALAGSPDLFVQKDGYPPQLDLSALQAPASGYGYHFAPYGYNLTFNGRFHNGLASDYCSSGLTVIAPARKQK